MTSHEKHDGISNYIYIWQCVKTLYPCSSHQNSWDLWMFIPLKMVLIGTDPYPYISTQVIYSSTTFTSQHLYASVLQRHCIAVTALTAGKINRKPTENHMGMGQNPGT